MQSKKESLKESIISVFIGFLVGVLSQILIFPLFDINVSVTDNVVIAFYFTIIGVLRGYLVRRWFNKRTILLLQKELHDFNK